MGLTAEQWKIFAMFAGAFVLSGCASVYAQHGVSHLAIAFAAVALGLIGDIIQKARAQ